MAYANVIAILSGGPDDRTVLSAAAGLVRRSHGVVRVLLSLPVEAASVWADAFGAGYIAAETIQAIGKANAEVRLRAAALAEDVAAAHGFAFGDGAGGDRIEMADPRETAWLSLMREAPMADLVVMGDSVVRVEGFWNGVAAEALLFARTPILIARPDKPLAGEVAAIAWDGSLPAGRAVRTAMPLLQAASSVVILQDPKGLTAAEQDAGDPLKLKEELARRGLRAVTIAEVSGGREGPRLLEAARAAGAGLIVSGAYGHSRLGEALFGGATRAFVTAEPEANLFLAH
jgi:nucleotide-binding universal stress UspA family protein